MGAILNGGGKMSTRLYRLGGGRGGAITRKRRFAGALAFVAASLAALVAIFNGQVAPFVSIVAESEAKNKIVRMLEGAVVAEVERGGIIYSDLIRLSYKADGSVSSLECDIPNALRVRGRIASALLDGFRDVDEMKVEIPIGNLSGIEALSGRGPCLEIKLLLVHGLRAYIGSDFEEAGINQTVHRVTVCMDVEISVMTPTHTSTVYVQSAYPIAETVIVGDVPDAYTKIDRLTDDITEDEIDDLYDFGAGQS